MIICTWDVTLITMYILKGSEKIGNSGLGNYISHQKIKTRLVEFRPFHFLFVCTILVIEGDTDMLFGCSSYTIASLHLSARLYFISKVIRIVSNWRLNMMLEVVGLLMVCCGFYLTCIYKSVFTWDLEGSFLITCPDRDPGSFYWVVDACRCKRLQENVEVTFMAEAVPFSLFRFLFLCKPYVSIQGMQQLLSIYLCVQLSHAHATNF